jgi:hypothetical protein
MEVAVALGDALIAERDEVPHQGVDVGVQHSRVEVPRRLEGARLEALGRPDDGVHSA